MKLCFLFCLMSMGTFRLALAQDILILSSKKAKNRILIFEGEKIRFRLKGEKHFNQEKITSIETGLIFLETSIIKINEIDAIDIRNHRKTTFDINSYAMALPFAGIVYILIDQFNHVLVDGQKIHINNQVLRTSGILISAGLLIKLLERKYYKPNKKRSIKVLVVGD